MARAILHHFVRLRRRPWLTLASQIVAQDRHPASLRAKMMSALVDIGSDQPFHPWDQVVANVDVDADHALAGPPFMSALSGRSKSIPKSTPLRIGQALQSRSRPLETKSRSRPLEGASRFPNRSTKGCTLIWNRGIDFWEAKTRNPPF